MVAGVIQWIDAAKCSATGNGQSRWSSARAVFLQPCGMCLVQHSGRTYGNPLLGDNYDQIIQIGTITAAPAIRFGGTSYRYTRSGGLDQLRRRRGHIIALSNYTTPPRLHDGHYRTHRYINSDGTQYVVWNSLEPSSTRMRNPVWEYYPTDAGPHGYV